MVYDDSSSKSKEENLAITKFDGGNVGTKGEGIKSLVRGYYLLTNKKLNIIGGEIKFLI